MKYILFALLTCLTVLGQRTPFSVNGVVVANANLTNTATITWTLNGSDIIGTSAGGDTIWTNDNGTIIPADTADTNRLRLDFNVSASPRNAFSININNGSNTDLYPFAQLVTITGGAGDFASGVVVRNEGVPSTSYSVDFGDLSVGVWGLAQWQIGGSGLPPQGMSSGVMGEGIGDYAHNYGVLGMTDSHAISTNQSSAAIIGYNFQISSKDASAAAAAIVGQRYNGTSGSAIIEDTVAQLDSGNTSSPLIIGRDNGVRTYLVYTAAPDGTTPHFIDTSITHTSGNLQETRNNTILKSWITSDGSIHGYDLNAAHNAGVVGTLSVTDQITNAALTAATVVYASATQVLSSIAPGNSGDVLTSAGAGVAPSFSAPFAGTANTVVGSGTTAANDIAVFTSATHTNIARSTSAGNLGDSSSATYTLNIGLSGATDPSWTFANGSVTLNVPLTFPNGSASAPSAALGSATYGFYRTGNNIAAAINGALTWYSDSGQFHFNTIYPSWNDDTFLQRDALGVLRVTSTTGGTLGGFKAGTLTLTPAAADTTALTVSGSVTGSATGPTELHNTTFNSSGVVIHDRTVITNTASAATSKFKTWETSAGGVLASVQIDGLVSTVAGLSSSVSTTPIAITATGVTNTFGKLAQALFDGVGLTFTVYNGAGTPIYTNTAALAGGHAILQANGKIIITGTGAVGTLSPL